MEKSKFLCILSLLFAGIVVTNAQNIPAPPQPGTQSFQPSSPQHSYTPNQPNYSSGNNSYHGNHANSIIEQNRRNAAQRHGVPYYPQGATAKERQQINQAYAIRNARKDQPNAPNNYKQSTLESQVRKEMMSLLNESRYVNQRVRQTKHYSSPEYINDLPNYLSATDKIKSMLSGETEISIKDAYFYAEAAYGGLQVDYNEYNQLIVKSRDFILHWLRENKYDINNPEALHYGIQKFMKDTLWVTVDDPDNVFNGSHKVAHLPFSYDFVDYSSTKDRRNYFVTKTLATGTGQCHTLPVTYLILAEALGVEASLSINPDHSFIRYQNNQGTWLNYETTIGRFMPDQIYLDMLPTMAKAYKNDAYLKALNKKQLLSTVLIDLAVNFTQEHWFAEPELINDCIQTAEAYFPNTETINAACAYLKKKAKVHKFNNLVQEYQITSTEEIEETPEVKAALIDLQTYLMRVKAMGLERFPEEEYMRIMAHHDERERLQREKNIDTKSKKNLFIKK